MKSIFLLPVFILASLSFFPSKVLAQNALRYPIAELGYCRDAKECFLYCEIPANKAACWSYGTYKLGPQVLGTTTLSPEEKAAMQAKAKELGITFPIAELGNCAGPQECKDFCEQPANQTTCMNFAKNRGLDRGGGPNQGKEQEILTAAQAELGCATKESCFQKCSQDHAACEAFAKRHGIAGPPPQSGEPSGGDKEKLLNDAKSQLGCTSMESCSQLCQQNPQRCEAFAKQHGLGGGGTQQGPSGAQGQYQQGGPPGQYGQSGATGGQKGPGGCDSETSCKAYCQNHPSECSGFQSSGASGGGNYPSQNSGSYVGPSGCRTQEECAAYCKANPSTCPGFSQGQQQNGGSGGPPRPSGGTPYPIPSGGTGYPQQYQPQQQYQQPSPPPGGTYPSGNYSPLQGTSYPSGYPHP